MDVKIIIHGGFFSESSTSVETKKAKQDALLRIVSNAYQFLQSHNAIDSVTHAVKLLEDDPLFNAGTGSQIQSDGKIRLSASLMDGTSKKFSGVINVEKVQNPILVARELLQQEDRVLGGEVATNYARKNGFPPFSVEIPQRRQEYETKKDQVRLGTVGCVALDSNGKIAAATSTGGKGFEIPGRVSDSATTAGNFANQFCGVSCTGVGEDITSVALASAIATRVKDGNTLEEAFQKSFAELKEIDGFAGAIAINKDGSIFHLDSHPSMVFAYKSSIETVVFE